MFKGIRGNIKTVRLEKEKRQVVKFPLSLSKRKKKKDKIKKAKVRKTDKRHTNTGALHTHCTLNTQELDRAGKTQDKSEFEVYQTYGYGKIQIYDRSRQRDS